MSAPAPTADHHWLDHLSDSPTTLELPLDGSRPPVAELAQGRVRLELSTPLCAKIASLAKQAGGAPFSVILVAWQTLLARLSRQEEVLTGVWVMDRGPFPFRSGGKEEPGFLARVRRINALINKNLPLPAPDLLELAAGLDHPAAPGVHPLFQAGIALHAAEPEPATTTLDVLLQVVPSTDGCTLILEHQTGIVHPETAARWLSHLRTLLEAASEEPDHSIFTLPLLTAAEREILSLGLNAGVREFPSDECLHHWFERVVETTPEAPALTFQDTTLSYAELNRRANRIAHFLIAEGVRPDTLVGLCLERGVDLVVALLGIMKSGGACLPVDLGCPFGRVAFMLKDASAHVLLTSSALAERLPTAVKTVSLDEAGLLDHRPDWNPATATAPEHLACVMYTSGTDGRPKGSLLTHAGIVRLLLATDDWFQFGPTDVWTLFHSTAQDLSLWEIWGALLYGGRLVVVPWAATRSSRDFYKLLSSEKVTVLNQTPGAFRQLTAARQDAQAQLPPDLRFIILSGDLPEQRSLKPWFDRHGDTQPRLVSLYGVTETTVHATWRPLSAADESESRVLGIPLPDTRLYILDDNGEPVPPGVPGELCIGGAGLARGYLNRPELTEKRFVTDPFSDCPGARLCRTGDRVRLVAAGAVEHLGRMDRQVNLGGVRLDPVEIESALASHPAVAAAAVAARTTAAGEQRLTAWLVPSETTCPATDALRAHLLKSLPDCMLPADFVVVPELPVTRDGRLNPSALPAPRPERPDASRAFVAPATELETRIAALWTSVLGLPAVSVEDNFFELGGTSLLMTRIQQSLRTDAGHDCPLSLLLQHPTVAGLAAALASVTTETRRHPRPAAYRPTRLQLAALRAVKARAHAGLLRSTP